MRWLSVFCAAVRTACISAAKTEIGIQIQVSSMKSFNARTARPSPFVHSRFHFPKYLHRHVVRVEGRGDAAVNGNLQQHFADLLLAAAVGDCAAQSPRSEEHTSQLQSRRHP